VTEILYFNTTRVRKATDSVSLNLGCDPVSFFQSRISNIFFSPPHLLPIHERAPPLNGQNASRGQSPRKRSGLKA
jgi:hypothetical protein